jgi:hypothetical protein
MPSPSTSARAGGPAATDNQRNFYGDSLGLFTLLVIAKGNDTVVRVPSDATWAATTRPA